MVYNESYEYRGKGWLLLRPVKGEYDTTKWYIAGKLSLVLIETILHSSVM